MADNDKRSSRFTQPSLSEEDRLVAEQQAGGGTSMASALMDARSRELAQQARGFSIRRWCLEEAVKVYAETNTPVDPDMVMRLAERMFQFVNEGINADIAAQQRPHQGRN